MSEEMSYAIEDAYTRGRKCRWRRRRRRRSLSVCAFTGEPLRERRGSSNESGNEKLVEVAQKDVTRLVQRRGKL